MSALPETLPGGLTLRPGRPDDVDGVTAMIVAEETHLRGGTQWSTTDTLDWWRGLESHGESWVVEDAVGTVVAAVGLFRRGDRFNCWIAIAPEHKHIELHEALVDLAEQRVLATDVRILTLGALAEDVASQRLFERLGYAIVRRFYRMKIEFVERPQSPEWPDGIICTAFEPKEVRAFYEATVDAFAENWDFIQIEFEEWKRLRFEAPDFDPSLWFVARDGEEIAGFARCEADRWGGGWVALLGVRKPWRRRGLGEALLRHAFSEFFARGERQVGLGVDAQNESGATRLYERAGMHVEAEDIVYEKVLA
jgi:mycothiol synthase